MALQSLQRAGRGTEKSRHRFWPANYLGPWRVFYIHGLDLVLGQGAFVKVEVRDPAFHVMGEWCVHSETTDGERGFPLVIVAEVGFSKQNLKGITSCIGLNS